MFLGFFFLKVENGNKKSTIEALDTAAEDVHIFSFAACDAPPPAVLLDGLVVFAEVSSR